MEGMVPISHQLEGLLQHDPADFKGLSKQKYVKGFLLFDDQEVIPYFIETGGASLIMVNGVQIATQLLQD